MLLEDARTRSPAGFSSPLRRGAAVAAMLLAHPAYAVVFLPEETFRLPDAYLLVDVVASAQSIGVVVADADSTGGDPTQSFVASAEAQVVPGGVTSTAVNAFGVVRSSPFGGISLGWTNTILGTPTTDVGGFGIQLPSRRTATQTAAVNRFAVALAQGGVADVDLDLTLDGQLNFRFAQPLVSLALPDNVDGSFLITARAHSTRYGSLDLFEIDVSNIFSSSYLGELAAGQYTIGDFQLTVADILEGGQVVGKSIDYLATLAVEDQIFAQDGDVLALELYQNFAATYSGTTLESYALNFDRTFAGAPGSDTPGVAFSTVPLPASAWLLVSGLAAGLAFHRRQGRQQPGSGRPAGTTNEVSQ